MEDEGHKKNPGREKMKKTGQFAVREQRDTPKLNPIWEFGGGGGPQAFGRKREGWGADNALNMP